MTYSSKQVCLKIFKIIQNLSNLSNYLFRPLNEVHKFLSVFRWHWHITFRKLDHSLRIVWLLRQGLFVIDSWRTGNRVWDRKSLIRFKAANRCHISLHLHLGV